MKNISKVTYLYLFLLNVYEFHNFIPFCYLNTEQMKNVDPLFFKEPIRDKVMEGHLIRLVEVYTLMKK